ncbi:3-phosphoshikimate 1-carboxyvinyltransferase [Novipirellula artificiosorum]|uniref:3-phosphoshikimate 1-carboxyvinyltransferase n=1 Tax=Novipirellula artificiosorum TaxID=2528016 RepID=A0A5C6D9G9_9BACT|nr:3-phosphoshikimate 1-carboxyvinyltransferase [Novipirellula artificiosorum]TWU32805.1 3-phosphoshikimate 1-carboxyvinyltransferase [Novipirellula artificiosorum]
MNQAPAGNRVSNSDAQDSYVQVVPGGPVLGSITPPGSKSLTNRALICAAFAAGRSRLTGALRSEDTEVMIEALQKIGMEVRVDDAGKTIEVANPQEPFFPAAKSKPATASLFIANSGTTVRFLTAALSAFGGNYRLTGVPRMHQRPIGDLVQAIQPILDGSIRAESPGGCPPVHIDSGGWKPGQLHVAGSVSSQYLSGLMMAAPIRPIGAAKPTVDAGTRIVVDGELVSRPYVDMTVDVMRSFGANVTVVSEGLSEGETIAFEISALPQPSGFGYRGCDYCIEPDASAASYFWAAAAISGGRVTVNGLSRRAIQGDVGFVDVLEKMGCEVLHEADSITVVGKPLRGVDVDMNAISDTVQTLAVVALFADGPTRVRGVAHNRFKETDRIGDLACELRKLGAQISEHDDGLSITPPQQDSGWQGADLKTYHDHRMAMSLSLAGLKLDAVRIEDPSCTSKTYPEFFADLERLLGRPHRWGSAKAKASPKQGS